MELKHSGFPAIAAVSQGIDRPLWSVMIPTYNCNKYLARTLKSVLEQAPETELMQIEVIDNCSTEGDPEALVRDLGRGRVSFYRQSQNIGIIGNFNTCIERSVGLIVHILHSDDIVLPGFYKVLQEAFDKEPTIGAAFCRSIYIDEDDVQVELSPLSRTTSGVFPDLLERIASSHLIESPAFVVRRSVYEQLGGYHPDLFHAADTEMYMRIASHYPVWYESASLACYRKHSSSYTSSLFESGANIANVRRAIEISESYLPNAIATKLKEFEAVNAFRTVCWRLVQLDLSTASLHLREAFKCSHSFRVIGKMFLFLVVFLIEGGVRRSQKILSNVMNHKRKKRQVNL
jgi:glycosyltransferase involved in cell wall biosynthesis